MWRSGRSPAPVEHARRLSCWAPSSPTPGSARRRSVAIGVGGYALAALVLVQVLIEQSLGRERVWNAIDDPAKYAPFPGGALGSLPRMRPRLRRSGRPTGASPGAARAAARAWHRAGRAALPPPPR